jgi:hypothetical protein
MLVAYRLAGLSARRAYYAGVVALTQFWMGDLSCGVGMSLTTLLTAGCARRPSRRRGMQIERDLVAGVALGGEKAAKRGERHQAEHHYLFWQSDLARLAP